MHGSIIIVCTSAYTGGPTTLSTNDLPLLVEL
jgi:hypothetical protein